MATRSTTLRATRTRSCDSVSNGSCRGTGLRSPTSRSRRSRKVSTRLLLFCNYPSEREKDSLACRDGNHYIEPQSLNGSFFAEQKKKRRFKRKEKGKNKERKVVPIAAHGKEQISLPTGLISPLWGVERRSICSLRGRGWLVGWLRRKVRDSDEISTTRFISFLRFYPRGYISSLSLSLSLSHSLSEQHAQSILSLGKLSSATQSSTFQLKALLSACTRYIHFHLALEL